MFNDTLSIVRVKRYFKRAKNTDPNTKIETEYKVYLDWGIGEVDNSGLFIYGSPYQIFSDDIHGSPFKDSRILVEEEELPTSTSSNAPVSVPSQVAFKFPNI